MPTSVQGLIVCSGTGRRYAQSIGSRENPYPKHLERIGNKTLLEKATDSLLDCLPVTGVTYTIHERLENRYVDEIKKIAAKHRRLKFTYTLVRPNGELDLQQLSFYLSENLQDLRGSHAYLHEGVIALAYGDVFLVGDGRELKKDVNRYVPQIELGHNLAVYSDPLYGGTIYCLSNTHNFGRQTSYHPLADIHGYGLHLWNINDIGTLIEAKMDLKLKLTPDETNYLQRTGGKERR